MNPEKYFLGFPTSTHVSSLGYKKAEEAKLQQSCFLNSSTIQCGNWKRQSLRHEGFYFWCPRIPWDHYCSCWGDVSLIKKHIIDHHYIEWGSSCYKLHFRNGNMGPSKDLQEVNKESKDCDINVCPGKSNITANHANFQCWWMWLWR